MAKTPHKSDPKTLLSTPNTSCADTIALKTAQIVRQNNYSQMLNTGDAPANMPQKSRKKFGRPTKYKSQYCFDIIAFFDRPHTYEGETVHTNRKGESWVQYQTKANPVPLMCDFAQFLGTTVKTLFDWVKQFEEFRKATTHAQDLQLRHLATVTGLGLYNANWSVFMAKNISSWRDKKEIEHTGGVGIDLFIDNMINKAEEATQDFSRIAQHVN